jgi:hypothetical protein
MSDHSRHFLLLFLTVLFLIGTAQAQQKPDASEAEQVPDAALREKAFRVLSSVADQLPNLQSPENRARIGSNLVGSLWKQDEQRARNLLRLVEEDIRVEINKAANSSPRDHYSLQVFLQLRRDTVERIINHDAEVALTFLKATEPPPEDPPYDPYQNERAFELRLAKKIADDKPEVALQLGRKSLANGQSNDVLSLLSKLLRKSREHGLVFYKEIVKKLQSEDLREWPNLQLANGLAQSFPPPEVDESTYRDLINLFINTAYNVGCAREDKKANDEYGEYLCPQFASLLPQMRRVDPARAARLEQWKSDDEELSGWHKGTYELEDLVESGTIDEVLALAKKYPEIAAHIRIRAIQKAQASGDLERAVKLAEESGDLESQRYFRAQLEREQKLSAITDEELAQLQTRLSSLQSVNEQVLALLYVAERARKSNRRVTSKLLGQAEELIHTMRTGEQKTQDEIVLAWAYCLDNDERGFAIIESLLPKLNDLIDSAAKLDGYDTGYLRDGEWNMSAKGSLGRLLTGLAQNASYFAWCDFDRALSLTGQFNRTEIRLMAQLKLAQGILAGRPNRIQQTNYVARY